MKGFKIISEKNLNVQIIVSWEDDGPMPSIESTSEALVSMTAKALDELIRRGADD